MSFGGGWLKGKTYYKHRSHSGRNNVLHPGSCERCCPRGKCRDGCRALRTRRRSIFGGFVGSQRGRVGRRKGERRCSPHDCDALRRPSLSSGKGGIIRSGQLHAVRPSVAETEPQKRGAALGVLGRGLPATAPTIFVRLFMTQSFIQYSAPL